MRTVLTTTLFTTVRSLAHSGFLCIRSTFPSESELSVSIICCSVLKESMCPKMCISAPGSCMGCRRRSVLAGFGSVTQPFVWPSVNTPLACGITGHPWPPLTRWNSSRKLNVKRGWPQVRSEELREGWVGEGWTRKL